MRKHGALTSIEDLLAKAEIVKGVKVVSKIEQNVEKVDFDELVALGRKAHEQKKVLVILGCDFEGAKLILARSMDLDLDCAELAREAGKIIGGGGGGKPEFAQAGGSEIENLDKAITDIKIRLKSLL